MKKQIYSALVCLSFTTALSAQLENKGWWTRNLFTFQFFQEDAALSENRFGRHYQRYFTQPELGYVLNKRWMAGLVTQYEYINDRYDVPGDKAALKAETKRFYGAGPLLRHYVPISKRTYFMSEVYTFWSRETNEKVYSEFGIERKTNTARNVFGAGANPTIVYFLTRDLAFSITVVNIGYYAGKDNQSFTLSINPQQWLFGVEFYFEKKKMRTAN